MSVPSDYYIAADPEHIRRERAKARTLRQSSWWKQQLGQGLCYYCGQKFSKELLTMDHLVPIARGGKSTKKNCVVSCKECNTDKGAVLPVERTLREMQERGELLGTGEADGQGDNQGDDHDE